MLNLKIPFFIPYYLRRILIQKKSIRFLQICFHKSRCQLAFHIIGKLLVIRIHPCKISIFDHIYYHGDQHQNNKSLFKTPCTKDPIYCTIGKIIRGMFRIHSKRDQRKKYRYPQKLQCRSHDNDEKHKYQFSLCSFFPTDS